MKCIKCNKVDEVKGERAAMWALLALVLLAYFFSWSALLLVPFIFYIYKTRHSSRYVCHECMTQPCPSCGSNEKGDEYCKSLVCPFCGNTQHYSTSVSWPVAILLLILLPLVLMVGLFLIWLLIDLYLISLLISAPKCTGCGKIIYVGRFGM